MRLKVGVIGCGLVSQIAHLSNLVQMEKQYEIHSVCDIAPDLVDKVGARFHVPVRCTDYRRLIDENLDAVFILTRDHTEIAIAAAQAGKHIFVEKPLAFNSEQAEAIIQAADQEQVKLMVGYMRRFDPGIRYAQNIIREIEGPKLMRWHTSLGSPDRVVQEIYDVIRSQHGIPSQDLESAAMKEKTEILKAVSSNDPLLSLIYRLLLHLWIHEINILLSTFDRTPDISFALAKNFEAAKGLPGVQVLSILNYSSDATCVWETQAFVSNQNWDDQFAVFGNEQTIRVNLPHPYLRNTPSQVRIDTNSCGQATVEEIQFPRLDKYQLELMHFYECVTNDRQPLTNGQEALEDLKFITQLVHACTQS